MPVIPEAGGPEVQGYVLLHGDLAVSLSSMRLSFKKMEVASQVIKKLSFVE